MIDINSGIATFLFNAEGKEKHWPTLTDITKLNVTIIYSVSFYLVKINKNIAVRVK
jgi:hypothetical protein